MCENCNCQKKQETATPTEDNQIPEIPSQEGLINPPVADEETE